MIEKFHFEESKISIIPVWIDDKLKNYKKTNYYLNDSIRFLSVGRLINVKGFDGLISLCAKIDKLIHKSWTLSIVGSGLKEAELKALSHKLDLENKIEFLGNKKRTEIFLLMQNTDIYFQLSMDTTQGDHEGMPSAVLEAAAIGCPIVATNHGGIPEIINDGEYGFIVNDISDNILPKKINDLIFNKERRKWIG